MSRSEPLVCSGISGLFQDGEQFGLIGVQPQQQAIECGKTSAATEDAIEAGAHLGAASDCRRRAIGLQIGIEPPDEPADALLCVAVQLGEGVELMHQSLCVDPHSACRPTSN